MTQTLNKVPSEPKSENIISASVLYEATWEVMYDLGCEKWVYQEEQRKRENPDSTDCMLTYPGTKEQGHREGEG